MQDSPELRKFIASIFTEQSKREKAQKIERFRRLNKFVKKGQIVFCGSSLMEQFPINELLTDLGCSLTVYNRGVGGFTTEEMSKAMDECIFDLEPKYIFINIGTNDLNDPLCRVSTLLSRYESILVMIKKRLPEAKIFPMAYYPVNEEIGSTDQFMKQIFEVRTNARIHEANEGIRSLASRLGFEYIDANAGITDERGQMKSQYTIEGMHMYGDGYMEVLKILMPILLNLA